MSPSKSQLVGMKSVCMIVQNCYETDVRVRRKAEALVAAGYSVDVLSLRSPGSRETYTHNGVNVYTLSLGKKRGSLVRYAFEYALFFFWAFFRVLLLTRRRRYAIVDVNTLPDFLIFAALPARWMGAKLVLDMHEITPEFYMSKYGAKDGGWLVRVLRYLEKISFNCADYVVTINEPIQALLVQRGLLASKSLVVMNSADEGQFIRRVPPSAANDSSERFFMMYHGTLTPVYGLDIAIEAFAMVHTEMPGAEFWILGSGSEQSALAERVEKLGLGSKIKLIGQVPSAEIPEWLRRCSVGVLPIRRDVFLEFAFPNKLPEFIIMGKPVLMSRLRTIRHYFSEKALCYFEPNHPADLAEQMVHLYKDRSLLDQLASRAKEEYAPIRWDVMKQRYLALIEGAVESVFSVNKRPTPTEVSVPQK